MTMERKRRKKENGVHGGKEKAKGGGEKEREKEIQGEDEVGIKFQTHFRMK